MNRSGFTALAPILLIFILANSGHRQTKPVRVEGTVFDSAGAVIANEKIFFENEQLKYLVATNDSGQYVVELLPGEYKIRLADTGWLPLKPNTLEVKSANPITKNLYPVPGSVPIGVLIVVAPSEIMVPSISTLPASIKQQTGQVKGLVTDLSGARIPNAQMVFESLDGQQNIRTNDAGEYEISLSPSVYNVKVQVPGFCGIQKRIEVKAAALSNADFALKVSASHTTCEGDTPSAIFFRRVDKLGKPYSIEIGYEDRNYWFEVTTETSGDWYLYKAYGNIKVVVRFREFVIQADKISLHKYADQITAEGQVVIENENNKIKAKYVEFDFTKDKPILRLKQ